MPGNVITCRKYKRPLHVGLGQLISDKCACVDECLMFDVKAQAPGEDVVSLSLPLPIALELREAAVRRFHHLMHRVAVREDADGPPHPDRLGADRCRAAEAALAAALGKPRKIQD